MYFKAIDNQFSVIAEPVLVVREKTFFFFKDTIRKNRKGMGWRGLMSTDSYGHRNVFI